jgi:hypothetical protein
LLSYPLKARTIEDENIRIHSTSFGVIKFRGSGGSHGFDVGHPRAPFQESFVFFVFFVDLNSLVGVNFCHPRAFKVFLRISLPFDLRIWKHHLTVRAPHSRSGTVAPLQMN